MEVERCEDAREKKGEEWRNNKEGRREKEEKERKENHIGEGKP